jgi:hypothetical protein
MKTPGDSFDQAGLEDWLELERWPGSLAIGTTCSCDVSRLGRAVTDELNAKQTIASAMAFDREDIRRLAVDPVWRRRLLPATGSGGSDCDFEAMIRHVASLGGAVLAGQTCVDATKGRDDVFRVMVSNCGHCRTDEPSMSLDPQRFSPESLVHVIADSFADWCRGRFPREAAASVVLREPARPLRVVVGA